LNKNEILSAIEKLLNDPEQNFVLSTLTADGYPDSRLMGNICDKSLQEIWFSCQTGTRKTDKIAANLKSSVYFTSDSITVWLYGEASVTRDEAIRHRVWNERMLRIYPNGADSPNLTIILFVPKKVRFRERPGDYLEFELQDI
jgi:general stress protein 26